MTFQRACSPHGAQRAERIAILNVGMASKDSFEATVTTKGQITIPQPVRERLGLKPGDHVQFLFEHDRTLMRPARRGHDSPFQRLIGAWRYPAIQSIDDVNSWLRDLRDDDNTP